MRRKSTKDPVDPRGPLGGISRSMELGIFLPETWNLSLKRHRNLESEHPASNFDTPRCLTHARASVSLVRFPSVGPLLLRVPPCPPLIRTNHAQSWQPVNDPCRKARRVVRHVSAPTRSSVLGRPSVPIVAAGESWQVTAADPWSTFRDGRETRSGWKLQ